MAETSSLVATTQYTKQAEQWLEAIGRRENVAVLFFPQTDRLKRIQQFLVDKDFLHRFLGREKLYMFQVLDFDVNAIEDQQDIRDFIAEQLNFAKLTSSLLSFDQWIDYLQKHAINLVLVIPKAEKFVGSEGGQILSFLAGIVNQHDQTLSVLSFFETDITHPMQSATMVESMSLYQNLFYYPLYSEADTLTFINYLRDKWNFSMDKKWEQVIVKECGGHFWLVKEAVRRLHTGDQDPFSHDSMMFRVRTVFNSLFPSEQSLLEKIITRQKIRTSDEQHGLQYLQKMNAVNQSELCLIGLFERYLQSRTNQSSELTVKDNRIILNQVPVEKLFSRKEYRVMKLFLDHRGMVVSREEIAQCIWPTNTEKHYSDWAIDQVIARVRKRMQQLSLSPSLLQVVRGKGYLLKLP